MPRRPIGDGPLSKAERTKRWRQRRGQPATRNPQWSEKQREASQRRRDAEAAERGLLFQRMNAATKADDAMLGRFTVMDEKHDPYRQDTPARRRDGEWFANQMVKFVPVGTVHIRGFHYILAAHGRVKKPDGEIYRNTFEDWRWLANEAATRARWLTLVPHDRIVDERNSAPEVFTIDMMQREGTWLDPGADFEVPTLDELMPYFDCNTVARQPYRIIFVGEKSSLKPILMPLAQQVAGELILPSGDISDTLIYGIAERAAADPRPAVPLYFSDFDPSGYHMPAVFARKLQALRNLYFPDLDISVYPVALNFEQARDLNLPSTPLKDTERRGGRWLLRWGREQTEIDALAALQPDTLTAIVREALTPFFDFGLAERIAAAAQQWRTDANAQLQADPRYTASRAVVSAVHRVVAAAAETLEEARNDAYDSLSEIVPPEFELPQPEITAEAPEPLFNSNDEWAAATRKLIEYDRGDPEPTEPSNPIIIRRPLGAPPRPPPGEPEK
jgi:hypothetical protein